MTTKPHWEQVYQTKKHNEVSWYQDNPTKSYELIVATGVGRKAPIIDVGGGTSHLIEVLLESGFSDLTVLDISGSALQRLRERLGPRASLVTLIEADVTEFQPQRRFAVWHDRAVFHFLIKPEERQRYIATLRRSLEPQGQLIIASFGPEGPLRCSGLEVMRYTPEALSAELGSSFHLVESAEEFHTTPTGAKQQFVYCRFQAA